MWLSAALLLLCLPGGLPLEGPSFVTGTTGDSLTIRCWYEKGYRGYNKYWCRGQQETHCDKIVETEGTEEEERNGHVSIRDNADDLVFTVTMRNLRAADAGTYWCKIQTVWILDAWSRDPSLQVQVSVSPGQDAATSANKSPAARTSKAVVGWSLMGQYSGMTAFGEPSSAPLTMTAAATAPATTSRLLTHCPGVALSTVHFLLPVFLKLAALLGILSAILWVTRCRRGPGGRRRKADQGPPPHYAPAPGKPCPGVRTFRLDGRDLRTLHPRAGRQ